MKACPPPYIKQKISICMDTMTIIIFIFLGQRVTYKLLYEEDIILNTLIDRIKHFEVKFKIDVFNQNKSISSVYTFKLRISSIITQKTLINPQNCY